VTEGTHVFAVAAGLAVTGGFGYRFYVGGQHRKEIATHQETLCQVIRRIVVQGDAALDGIAYYKRHPAERRAAHQRTRDTLRQLDCSKIGDG
jgi:hypothetical protein